MLQDHAAPMVADEGFKTREIALNTINGELITMTLNLSFFFFPNKQIASPVTSCSRLKNGDNLF